MAEPTGTGTDTGGSISSPSAIDVMQTNITPFNIAELTEKSLTGAGVFDILVQTTRLHLDREWNAGRITGTEYANVYIELMTAAMSQSIEYAARRAILGYQIQGMINDNAYKMAQVEIAQQQLAKIPFEIEQLQAETARVKADTEQRLPVEIANMTKQGLGIDAQTSQTVKQTEMVTAQIAKIPEEITLMQKQVLQTVAQTEAVTYDTLNKVPVEVANITKQGELITQQIAESTYRVTNMLPVELSQLTAKTTQISAETALIGVNTEAATANLAKVPIEVELLRKQSLKADAEVALGEKQVERITAELTKIPYEVTILGKQAAQIQAQTDQSIASTTRIVTETEQLLPVEIANATKQGLILDGQVTLTGHQSELARLQATMVPVDIEYKQAQIANMARQSLILERELDLKVGELALQTKQISLAELQIEVQREELEVKKAQVTAQEAQSELYRQKVVTEKAQVDASVVLPGSIIDMNNKVLEGQVMAYKFDAQNRAAKLLLDTFVTTYNQGDRSVNAQNRLTDTDIGKVMGTMYTTIGVV